MSRRSFQKNIFSTLTLATLTLAGTLWTGATPILAAPLSAPLSSNDQQVANKLFQANNEEIALGHLVVEKAKNNSVKEFGQRMIDDHTALQNQLKQWAQSQHFSLTPGPSHKAQTMKSELSHLSGAEFDQRYIQEMMMDHQKDVAELQGFLASTQRSPLKPIIEKTLPIVENHIRIAENVAGQLNLPPHAGLNQPEHPKG